MKALKIAGIIVLAVTVITVVIITFLPSHAHVERSIVADAKPEQVFQHLNNFESLNAWSPWAKLDPDTKYKYTGAGAGVGAVMDWVSHHKEVGSGSQKIVEAEDNKRVKMEMAFEGFEGKSYAEFILSPEGEGTKITWTYDGDLHGVYKVFGVMMDGMLGPRYEQGLQSLKQLTERNPAAQSE